MTDEQRPADTATPEEGATATAPQPEGGAAPEEGQEGHEGHGPEEKPKLHQAVEIRDVGPCKKHIKVSVERQDIEHRLNDKFKELVTGDTTVPGFRPGKAPRKLIERRFHTEVADQVKAEILLASLEQLADEHDIAPLAPPDLDPFKVDLPKEGPLVYEFEVEVRPEFDLPNYRGLRLKKPVKQFTDEDVDRELRRLLAPHAQIVPKPEGNAQVGDILISDLTVRDGERVLNSITEYAVRIEPRLAFKDGVVARFAEQVQGANPGDSRVVDLDLASSVADPTLRSKRVQATFAVKDVKTLRMPELTHEFLHHFGVHSEEQLRELIRVLLQRRLEHVQRQSAREQVIQQMAAASQWQLPEDLLVRQARKAMARKVMEMRSDGISEEEIRGRQRLLEQDILRSTALALKEHFVLQKIAEVEKIDVNDEDIEAEIERIAEQNDESPRRVRARMEKEDLLEALAAEIIERKALDLILDGAEYEEVPLGQQEQAPVATVDVQTVPGEMHDPTATPPAPAEGPAAAPAPEQQPPPAQG
jgi:trigger factor